VGRFPTPEAGSAITDGALVGYRLNSAFQLGTFGGLNPQRVDQTYTQWNSDSQNFGFYSNYQPDQGNWYHSTSATASVVAQRVQQNLDRLYFYGNYYRQWNSRNSFVALGYLDFVPSFRVQTAYLSQGLVINPRWYATGTLSAIDVIEYTRRRGVLEKLPASNYQETSISVDQKQSQNFAWKYNALYGMRTSDHLSRIEGSAGVNLSNLGTKHFNLISLAGYRRNFTSVDEFIRSTLGYTSKRWEGDVYLEYGLRKQTTGTYNHPLICEVSYANYLSKALYSTISIQYAKNEEVRIVSGFLKVGYRFGSDDVAPLRDGSPPAGGRL
jgi:hypothetical protein